MWNKESYGKLSYSLVVPCYNSDSDLLVSIKLFKSCLEGLGNPHEIILVDDCSDANQQDAIFELVQELGGVRIIRLSQRYGQHACVAIGAFLATNAIVITTDDDFPISPDEMFAYLNEFVRAGSELAYITLANEVSFSLSGCLRALSSRFGNLVIRCMLDLRRNGSNTRFFYRSILDNRMAIQAGMFFDFSLKMENSRISYFKALRKKKAGMTRLSMTGRISFMASLFLYFIKIKCKKGLRKCEIPYIEVVDGRVRSLKLG